MENQIICPMNGLSLKRDVFAASEVSRSASVAEPPIEKLDSFYDNYSDEPLSVSKYLNENSIQTNEDSYLQRFANNYKCVFRWNGKTYVGKSLKRK